MVAGPVGTEQSETSAQDPLDSRGILPVRLTSICPAYTFDYPVSDHRRGVKVVSCPRGGSNPSRHQLLAYRPTS